ncbi:hypothetical protein ACIRU5_35660 [Streptomyces misionensis]|uniref:hypothetical protein n=1 Tax=Streptomyces misionensis TaxID=67331 RepID=UPI0037F494AA
MLTPDQSAPQSGETPDTSRQRKIPLDELLAGPPDQLDYPPVRNGVDYLVSVVDHLTNDRVDPRGIKYAVLHLQAAAEVLLKARLVREHWSLVFEDPGRASERDFRSASFKSCTIGEAVTRLRNIVGVTITDAEERALNALARDRNALQHYGLTHNARAVEARAGSVLDFLVRFLDDVLLPKLTFGEALAVQTDMDRVRDGLTGVQTYITQRLRRLRGELRGLEDRTVACPHCEQMTLVAEGRMNRCLFCGAAVTTKDMMVYIFLGSPEEDGSIIDSCPRCGQDTVMLDTELATGDRAPFCFNCPGALPPADIPRERP